MNNQEIDICKFCLDHGQKMWKAEKEVYAQEKLIYFYKNEKQRYEEKEFEYFHEEHLFNPIEHGMSLLEYTRHYSGLVEACDYRIDELKEELKEKENKYINAKREFIYHISNTHPK